MLKKVDVVFDEGSRKDSKRKKAEEEVMGFLNAGLITESQFDEFVNSIMANASQTKGIEDYSNYCDSIFQKRKNVNETEYNEWLNHVSFKLMEYNTLKFANKVIGLEDCINKQINMELIDSKEEMMNLLDKLGITNFQVSSDIEIVNCTYGYTRKASDPKKNNNPNCLLKLNAYSKSKDGDTNLVYGAKLKTEGILFEFSQRKIILWLYKNNVIREEQLPDLDDELSIKKWFAENINSAIISNFGDIDNTEIITKRVFELLHSISHALLKTAGEISGLSSNSLSEIIMVDTASVFIYAQSSQGLPLGSLSGLAESNSAYYLRKTIDDNKNCIYDPICAEDNTSCSACLLLPEISCNHFNSELGRKYIYTISNNKSNLIGFWEM